MPWKAADAKKHTGKATTPAMQKQWAAVANAALAKCLEGDGEQATCEASAIKMANSAIAKAAESAVLAGEGVALSELSMGLHDLAATISGAFYALFDPPLPGSENASRGYRYWCRDVYAMHPVLGNSLVVEVERDHKTFAVPYAIQAETIVFAPAGEWREVRQVYEYVDEAGDEYAEPEPDEGDAEPAELAESFEGSITGHALAIAEAGDVASGGTAPLILEIAAISPGWGNRRDNHYYPAEMLAEFAPRVLRDVKMFESNHGADKTNREWVSTILETGSFLEDGSPVSRVGVHDPGFAQRVQALAALGKLHLLECSILASGRARKYEEGGRKGKLIEEIYAEPRPDVDWVTRAGAGGRALAIAESAGGEIMPGQTEPPAVQPEQPERVAESESETVPIREEGTAEQAPAEEPTFLAEAEVQAGLPAGLPQVARDRLLAGRYAGAADLETAVAAEVEYVKALTGSGRPWGQGGSQPPGVVALSEEEKRDRFNQIMRQVGAREV